MLEKEKCAIIRSSVLFFICALLVCLSACHEAFVSDLPMDLRSEINASLQHVENSNNTIQRAVALEDYVTVRHTSSGEVFSYKGKTYSKSKYIPSSQRITFVYFYNLYRDGKLVEILQGLQARGIKVQYVILSHNGIGNIAYPLYLPMGGKLINTEGE